MSDRKKAFWFIALLSVLVVVPFLGETIFYSKGEPREVAQAVTDTKLEELTREVRAHNNFAQRVPVLEEQMRVANHRITDLENRTA